MSQEPEKQTQIPDGPAGLQHEAEHARPGKKNPVLFYLLILFIAAFLLLLMSYFMQQRANQDAMNDLKQTSNSATQSLDNLIQERDALEQQAAALESQLGSLENRLDEALAEKAILEGSLAAVEQQAEAMNWFWQIDDYYARGYFTQAKAMMERFEAKGLPAALPEENTTGTDRFSPAQRYQEINEALY